ncbi:response regulator transcription factor [Parasulfuritortus cantonensis]|uniref:Response regulator transcription factor n=1 Tax=Parasulfuritortus cantonensis TaxID=2528202 RepID=A0A4R1BIN2_9PROT|nr:response regulator transcription factor [Parasulfuritortus cantonensis]TCJ17185.1 response regulator transcription factor [Parasulfuritortus cantonensis]
MQAIRVVVVERDDGVRAQLAARLRELGVAPVCATADLEDALDLCAAQAPQLLLCGLPVGLPDCLGLLHGVAALKPAPAVAFHGADSDIDQLETACLNLGLRYLGLLAAPASQARLQRMVGQLRAFPADREARS